MKFWRTLKNHFLPWSGNAHRPHMLRRQWLLAFLGLALASEVVILGAAAFSGGPHVFLAAVVRSDVVSYTIEARTGEGRGALRESEILNAAAQAKAEDMAAREYFSHTGPDGEEPWAWLERAGYQYSYAGENLAVRFSDSKHVVEAWMDSPKHRANIIKPQYEEIGIGIAEGRYKGTPTTYVVQFFASPAASPVAASVSTIPPAGDPVAGAEVEPAPVQAATQAPAPKDSLGQTIMRLASEIFTDARAPAAWTLAAVAMLLVAVLGLTFFIRIQIQPTDLLIPGAAVALVAVTLIGANTKFLPASTQSASVAEYQAGDVGSGAAIERVPVAFPEHPAE